MPDGGPGFAEQHAERAALVSELARLPRRQKAVLVLRYLEDLSDAAIADTLGCSTGTVRSHASRGLATLRVEMAPAPPSTPATAEEGTMRTEQQLVEALESLADEAPDPEEARDRILARATPRPVRRRRFAFVLVAALLAVVAVAVPALLVDRAAEPADTRSPGSWNLVHRVDLPPDWSVLYQLVHADFESTTLTGPEPTRDPASCTLTVHRPGVGLPVRGPDDTTVDIHGVPGFAVEPTPGSEGRVHWPYSPGAWATVSCQGGAAEAPGIARQVVFEPVQVRLPFRLPALPPGYQVQTVMPPAVDPANFASGAVALTATDATAERPPIQVNLTQGIADVPRSRPGREETTVAGQPAVLNPAEGQLCVYPRGHSLCLDASTSQPDDQVRKPWPAGYRELLLELAEGVVLAGDLDDRSTWFPADEAIPS